MMESPLLSTNFANYYLRSLLPAPYGPIKVCLLDSNASK